MTSTLNPIKRRHDRCRTTRAQISEYLDGELDEQAAAHLERHTRWCPNCGRMLASLTRTIDGLRRLPDLPLPADEPERRG